MYDRRIGATAGFETGTPSGQGRGGDFLLKAAFEPCGPGWLEERPPQ
jgi:hypothetical protein